MDLILGIISITAFVLSVGQLIGTLISRRTNIDIVVEDMQFYNFNENDSLILFITFINKSSTSICVNKINVFDRNDNSTSCCLIHKYVGIRNYPTDPETKKQQSEIIFSADFPIKIESNSVSMQYIKFKLDKNFKYLDEDHFIRLELITNKKKQTLHVICPKQRSNPLSL